MHTLMANLAATLHTLGVTGRDRIERLKERARNEDGLTTLEYAIIGGVLTVAAVGLAAVVYNAITTHSASIK